MILTRSVQRIDDSLSTWTVSTLLKINHIGTLILMLCVPEAHTELAKDSTLQGFVLLQNGNDASGPVLPFETSLSTAVIGPLAKAQVTYWELFGTNLSRY